MYKTTLKGRTASLALKTATKSDQDGLKSRGDWDAALEETGSGGLGGAAPRRNGDAYQWQSQGKPRAARRPLDGRA